MSNENASLHAFSETHKYLNIVSIIQMTCKHTTLQLKDIFKLADLHWMTSKE